MRQVRWNCCIQTAYSFAGPGPGPGPTFLGQPFTRCPQWGKKKRKKKEKKNAFMLNRWNVSRCYRRPAAKSVIIFITGQQLEPEVYTSVWLEIPPGSVPLPLPLSVPLSLPLSLLCLCFCVMVLGSNLRCHCTWTTSCVTRWSVSHLEHSCNGLCWKKPRLCSCFTRNFILLTWRFMTSLQTSSPP